VIRGLTAIAALVAAVVLVALAVDVGRWRSVGPRPPATLVGGVAEHVLGTGDDVALRRALRSFRLAELVPRGFDNGVHQGEVRAMSEGQLAGVAATAPAAEASQADNLIGVLAWGSTSAPAGVLDPADRAVQAFTNAARLDPSNSAAEFNLELALRALAPHGQRVGVSPGSTSTGTGNGGAGSGGPGSGY
jgi:hypothetical protein